MTRIKCCGMRRREDIEAVNRLLPDYIGFIFVPGRRRRVTIKQAEELYSLLDHRVKAYGVFMDCPLEQLLTIVQDAEAPFDGIQLHGHEDAAYIKALRRATNKPILQAFRVSTPESLEEAENSAADAILLDAPTVGEGKTFDWTLIGTRHRPFFLAGGLTCENIEEAIRLCRPFAVDVSSGIETDGVKDPIKMEQMIRKTRQTL